MDHQAGRLKKSVLKLSAVINAISSVWVFLIMFLVTADVCGRVFLNRPILGVPELTKVSIVGIVFMGLSHTLWTNRFIRSDIILQKLTTRAQEVMNILAYLLGITVFIAIFVASWQPTVDSYRLLEFEGEGSLSVPVYPIRTLILLGSLMTALTYLFKLADSVKVLLNKK